jgi:hypothetical protein
MMREVLMYVSADKVLVHSSWCPSTTPCLFLMIRYEDAIDQAR